MQSDTTVPTFKNILCPVDFSMCSRHALTVATELAASSRAAIMIVHIWQVQAYGAAEGEISGEVIQSLVDDAARTLGDWEASAKAAGLPAARSKMVNGVAWNEIVRLLEDDRTYDLVVMGTHGRTGLKRVLIGSVAERVVRHAPCAVLVVR